MVSHSYIQVNKRRRLLVNYSAENYISNINFILSPSVFSELIVMSPQTPLIFSSIGQSKALHFNFSDTNRKTFS